MIRAVLFDLDLTLLDRDQMYRNFANEQATKYTEDARSAAEYMIARDEHGYGDHNTAYAAMIQRWKMPITVEALQRAWVDFMKDGVIVYPEVKRVLEQLKKRYLLGIVTNGESDTQWGKLRGSGLQSYFDAIVVSEDIHVEKPDARIFQRALDLLKVSASETVHVGDHLRNDVQGALGAGIQPIWIDRGSHPVPDGCLRIHTMEELPAVIQRIGGIHE